MLVDNIRPMLDQLLLLVTDTERYHVAQEHRGSQAQTIKALLAVLAEFRATVN